MLTLRRDSESSALGAFSHELSSPEGHPPVGPADSLYEATYELDQLLQAMGGGVFKKAVYVAKSIGKNWSFEANFDYAQAL